MTAVETESLSSSLFVPCYAVGAHAAAHVHLKLDTAFTVSGKYPRAMAPKEMHKQACHVFFFLSTVMEQEIA